MKKLYLALLPFFMAPAAFADSALLVNPDNGHSYKRFDTQKEWPQAEVACEAQGAHLATVTSQAENNWIISKMLTPNIAFWLGGSDTKKEGVWQWVNGEVFSYTNWAIGQPQGGREDWLLMGSNGEWHDGGYGGHGVLPYVCEWESIYNQYSRIIELPDVNTNGVADFALLASAPNNYQLFVYDGDGTTVIKQTTITERANKHIGSVEVIGDVSGNGATDLAIVIRDNAKKTSSLQVQDSLSGAILKTTELSKGLRKLLFLGDINSDSVSDFATVVSTDTEYQLLVYDGRLDILLAQTSINEKTDYKVYSVTLLQDRNQNGSPEIAILLRRNSDQTTSLQIYDSLTGNRLKKIPLTR